ncbi:NAD(P)-binding domain-containing protein [Dactylosporangium sp. AC04546]|uniref:NADPH-dependent F420 reductase n=1 Tax=Dactylosporangium sp. AC04546 TaxID=2862460 RepID=UPI001EDE40AD|nr:NAD(P)-binding domain-containing protein [Dactylosporangium sp. AC04546]WVK87974.1 NAD(P)-binding domain-containing protein [Dactylosporangium sp. AC04546]
MTGIAILGSGNVARAIAGPLTERGHRVTIGSRTPDATRRSYREAAQGAEVVVNALPGEVTTATLKALEHELAGKVLVDVSNNARAERIQAELRRTAVVKALNTMHDSLMGSARITAFVAGNSAAAKETVTGLLRDLGKDPIVDLGDLTAAGWLEDFVAFVPSILRALDGPLPFGLHVEAVVSKPGTPR